MGHPTGLFGMTTPSKMAAARLRGLGLVDLSERLDDRLRLLRSDEEDRHESLVAVVVWSNDLLGADEGSLLEQLSVFAGSFDLVAVEVVCDVADVPTGSSTPSIARWCTKSQSERQPKVAGQPGRCSSTVLGGQSGRPGRGWGPSPVNGPWNLNRRAHCPWG